MYVLFILSYLISQVVCYIPARGFKILIKK